MQRIRFWGTRGSLPVALSAGDIRTKMDAALQSADGRHFSSEVAIDEFLEGLPMAVGGTYGGHSSCVEIETGGDEYVLCDLGSGVRPSARP